MMNSDVVDSTTTGTGTEINDSVFSDGDDTSNSGDEVERHGDEGVSLDSAVEGSSNSKRPFQDSQAEPDHCQAKKRRKQSKPVRLFSLKETSDEDSDEETEANNEGKVNEESPLPANEDADSPPRKVEEESVQNSESVPVSILDPESDHEFSSQCPYCPEILNPKTRLKFHIENGHVQKLFQNQLQHKVKIDKFLSDKPEIPLNLSNLPTVDSTSPIEFVVGSLVSEIRNQTDDSIQGTKAPVVLPQTHDSENVGPFINGKISLPVYMPLSPHFLLPFMSQGSGHNSSSSTVQSQTSVSGTAPIRIFNPDAYCELCNKEFCNKYFLKTHKANKHGIYVDNPGTTVSGNVISGSPYQGSFIQANLNLPPLTSPVQIAQTANISSALPKISETVIPNKPSGNLQMKAFCDICQKKFCNKYFVRRHKAKIHGIPDETLPTAGGVTFLNLPECIRKQECEEPGSTSAGSDTGSNIPEMISNDIFGSVSEVEEVRLIMHERQSKNNQLDLSPQSKLSPTNSGTDEGAEGSNVKQELEQEQEEGRSIGDSMENSSLTSIKRSPTPSKQPPREDTLSTDKLRSLGVINADAFCEICCKEYCNKYFLRTHKMKRHGIYFSESDGKEIKAGGSNSAQWNQNQTSPLNLIIGEQGTNSSDSGEKIRNDLSESDDPECDICGRRFQSYYLMQMHRAYLHTTESDRKEESHGDPIGFDCKSQERNNTHCEDGNISKSRDESREEMSSFNNNNDGGKDAISEDLQKLQTMILQLNNLNVSKVTTCNICNKESENYYCLRAHMLTEHGIVVEDQNGVGGETNSSLELGGIPPLTNSHTYCFSCKKEFFTEYQFKQHIDESHNYGVQHTAGTSTSVIVSSIKEEFEPKSPVDKAQGQIVSHAGSEKRISVTPTSSYCEICNKELCNKYFMKTHMQRMHGIEIENGAQIGGVICDICNKELCSKYFLRVHKQNTHGIVEEGSVSHSTRDNGNGHNMQTQIVADQALKPSELSDLSHRYYSHFNEVCPLCNRRFRSTKWLKAHLLNDHGENGVVKWKELENQYQIISQQSKHPLQVVRSSSVLNNSSAGPGSSYNPTLKIPNNWQNQDQDSSCTRQSEMLPLDRSNEVGAHQVFSSLFGSGDSAVKTYHCSYCPFTTTVLAFLFVHERSHAGVTSQPLPDPAKPFQCPVCLQSFLQADIFQHHILTHQFSGMLNPFLATPQSGPYQPQIGKIQDRIKFLQHSPNIEDNRNQERSEQKLACEVVEDDSNNIVGTKYKFRCSKCFQRFRSRDICVAHIQSKHSFDCSNTSASSSSSAETAGIKITPHGLYRCIHCGFSSVHLVIVKKHIKKEHKSENSQLETRRDSEAEEALLVLEETSTDDVKKKLQDAARKSRIPASYAVPQNKAPSLDQFIMQPFLLEEPNGNHSTEKIQLDRKFVPSLVFLPVKEKLSEPLTVSFTLTPA